MLDEDDFFTARQTYRILSMIYLRSSFSYNSRDISSGRFGRKPFFFFFFSFYLRLDGVDMASVTSSLVVDFYVSVVHAAVRPAKYGGYRSNHSRWCTRVTVTAWALAAVRVETKDRREHPRANSSRFESPSSSRSSYKS